MKVIIKGIGQNKGPVIIDLELELDDNIARSLIGSKKEAAITELLEQHYPGVKIDPRKMGVNIIP